MKRSARDESGLAAPLVVTLTALLLVLTLLAGVLGRLLVDQRRASAAADLAALAGAGALQLGREPCGQARLIAQDNGATLVRCEISGEQVVVRVAVRPTGSAGLLRLVGRSVSVAADARAGPVS